MKFVSPIKRVSLTLAGLILLSMGIFAQDSTNTGNPAATPTPAKRERISKNDGPTDGVKTDATTAKTDQPADSTTTNQTGDNKQNSTSSDDTKTPTQDTPGSQAKKDAKDPRVGSQSEEEAAIVPYYNNYLIEYHLGPEDVISVEVFGQPTYSKGAITVSPTAKISYPLIGAVFVGGKTTEQVEQEIAKRLDEYIINPQVTVTLDKVGSARYSVLGKVGAPGVKLMTRRYSVYEAVVEAGGFAPEADQSRVVLVRNTPAGLQQSVINFKELMSGKTKMEYLAPGDQVFIPEKKWSLTKVLDIMGKASAFRLLFGVPF